MCSSPPSPENKMPSDETLKCTDHSLRCKWYQVRLPVEMSQPATQKSSPRGVSRSYQIVLPSALQNSCPAISMVMVRLWMFVNPVPSERMIQMRTTFCHGPSWQNMSKFGSVGENTR